MILGDLLQPIRSVNAEFVIKCLWLLGHPVVFKCFFVFQYVLESLIYKRLSTTILIQ